MTEEEKKALLKNMEAIAKTKEEKEKLLNILEVWQNNKEIEQRTLEAQAENIKLGKNSDKEAIGYHEIMAIVHNYIATLQRYQADYREIIEAFRKKI